MKKVALMVILLLLFGLPAWSSAKEINLKVEGMECAMCPAKVEAAVKGVEGVKSCEVSFEKGMAQVQAEEEVKEEDLVKAVGESGHFKAQVTKK